MGGKTKMSNKKEISFAIGEQAHGIIKDKIVNKTNKYDSTKEFCEISVASNARRLQSLSSGGTQSRELILLLKEIRGISVTVPQDTVQAFILEKELSTTNPRIELTPEQMSTLNEIQRQTGMNRSEVIRRCTFAQMNHLINNNGLLRGWRKKDIRKTWEEIEAGLQRPSLKCHDILQRRFVDEIDRTERKIKADQQGFERFADEYVNEFHGSQAFKKLREKRSERALRNVENVIEEDSDFTIETENAKSGFLNDFYKEEASHE